MTMTLCEMPYKMAKNINYILMNQGGVSTVSGCFQVQPFKMLVNIWTIGFIGHCFKTNK